MGPWSLIPVRNEYPRQPRRLARDEGEQVPVEQRHVQGGQRLEVQLSPIVPRRAVPVEEVVVQRERERPAAVRQQLDREALGEGRLARRGGARDHDDAHLVLAREDVGGDAGDARLVQRLGDQRHLGQAAFGDRVVQHAGAPNPEPVEPFSRLGKRGEQPRVGLEARQARRVRLVRVLDDEAGRIRVEGELAEPPGRGQHEALEVVHPVPEPVEGDRVLVPVGQQPCLVVLAAGLERVDGLLARHPGPADRLVALDDRAHPRLDVGELGGRKGGAAPDPAEVRTERGRRVLHVDARLGMQLRGGRHQQQDERAAVDAGAVGVGQRDRLDDRVDVERGLQLAQAAVDDRGDRGRRQPAVALGRLHQVVQPGAGWRLEDAAVAQARVDAVSGRGPSDLARKGVGLLAHPSILVPRYSIGRISVFAHARYDRDEFQFLPTVPGCRGQKPKFVPIEITGG